MRWLDASPDQRSSGADDWPAFLRQAERLPARHRLTIARFWPGLAALNGVLAVTGLHVWPGAGVHLLALLSVFWLVPLLLWCWQAVAVQLLGRSPWWRPLLTVHQDRVISLWCARQALLAQLAFALAGLAGLWVMLLGREVVFYWSTSLPVVAGLLDSALALLSLGLIDAPDPLIVSASQAGAVSGWQQDLLRYSYFWAAWFSQVLLLWVLVPLAALLVVTQWRLRRQLRRWPSHNLHLRALYQAAQPASLHYQALDAAEPAQPIVSEPLTQRNGLPAEAGFGWQLSAGELPAGSQPLGAGSQAQDEARVTEQAAALSAWYCPARLVPTGDLADLLLAQRHAGGQPRLYLLAEPGADTDLLAANWRSFLSRQGLADLPLTLCWLE